MKYNSNIFKSEFVKNVLTLMTGTTIAVTPILTRIYTPDDFGVFALFLVITTIAGTVTVGEGRYVGAGATIISNLTIGKWVKIGAGAVIIQNVPDGEVMVGNPARNIKQ